MRGDRLARPGRAFLVRGGVADGEDEIHHRRAFGLELAEMLGAHLRHVMPGPFQHFEREGVEFGMGLGASGEGVEAALAQIAQQRLGKDRPGGVARADEECVVNPVFHSFLQRSPDAEGVRCAKIWPAAAAVGVKVVDQPADARQVGGVGDRPALPLGGDQASPLQRREIGRQRVGLHPQRLGNLCGPRPLRHPPHQQAQHRQAAFVTEDSERFGGGFYFHNS